MLIKILIRALAVLLLLSCTPSPLFAQASVDSSMSGSWFDPTHDGEGFALEILPDGSALVYWFTYDAVGNQRWFIGQGNVTGNTVEFEQLSAASGPAFGDGFDPDDVIFEDAGKLGLSWTDCNSASAQYTVDGVSGTQSLVRLNSLSGLGCQAAASEPSSRSGSWFDLTHDGEGLVIQMMSIDQALVYWFSYDAHGSPAWFFGLGELDGDLLVIDEMLISSGGQFGSQYDPQTVRFSTWGSLLIELGCSYGKLDYAAAQTGYGTGKQTLLRLTNPGNAACEEAPAPNILLVIADDLGLDASNQYGISPVQPNTPTLDALADQGLVFDNAWAFPVCSPTRSAILTGRLGIRTGVLNAADTLSTDELSLQSYINQRLPGKYAQAVIGKWHLGPLNNPDHPAEMGIDYFSGILGGGLEDYENWALTSNGEQSTESVYSTSRIADLAIDWITAQQSPWFLWLAFNAPHTPFHLPPGSLHSRSLPGTEEDILNNPLAYYLAAIEAMDTELGRVLNSMDPATRKNTTIIFLGDNGTPPQVAQTPFSQRRAKGSLFQGGINVPLLASGLGVSRQGERDGSMVTAADLFTTLASLVGVNVSEYQDSISFSGLLQGSREDVREFQYSEQVTDDKNEWAITNGEYKLIWSSLEEQKLFKIDSDPYENQNLVRNGTAPADVLEDLEARAALIRR